MKDKNLFLKIFPKSQQKLFEKLSKQIFIKDYYLAGGTALALLIGHRISIDFDFFKENNIDLENLKNDLKELGKIKIIQEKKNTFYCEIDNIRLSFIAYKYKLLDEFRIYDNLHIANLVDIACMKLSAICSRSSKKDFVDLYFLLQKFSLKLLLEKFYQKYGKDVVNEYQLLKAMIYFEEAENEPMPMLLENIKWEKIKESIIEKVQKYNFKKNNSRINIEE
ncbi:MAG TPA: nucleotidyl transferase AbiEii/AbiGii toxin family protein [bacterium]|mgnify:CR=1 FL=1|nr:nucleotidyl transferase AbiEii/AbiGii toxin family protein [bacterium]HON55413.1 nucleotidyl transferase AbiEii/AbiGii toxin family protein [bacterium]HPP87088.1 nucleotidyl transferase AbiEii/AbiGii toxin family protein [bacterium]